MGYRGDTIQTAPSYYRGDSGDPPIAQVTSDCVEPLDKSNETQRQSGHIEDLGYPVLPLASSSPSPDEAVAGASASGHPPIDHRAHQDLLRRIARNMDLQVEEIIESEDAMVDVLAPEGPSSEVHSSD